MIFISSRIHKASTADADATESSWRVPLSDVEIDDELVGAMSEVVRSGWWSMGPRVERLEATFARLTGSRHALAVSSGTAALHLALLALRCGPGDEVILPSLNFVAAANAIRRVGATPVFCDIEGRDHPNLDPSDVESVVGPATKAIVALHYAGFPCRIDALRDLADRYGLAIIEDAAHAPGARWHGQACGSLGNVGCFSFFANKNIPVGEGGMVVTDDDELAGRLRLLRSHGMTTLTWDRHRGHASGYDVLDFGFNYRLDEIRAALALVQVQRLESRNAARARIVGRYREGLGELEGLTVPFSEMDDGSTSAHHIMVVILPAHLLAAELRRAVGLKGIQTSVHYPPIHRFSAFAPYRRELPRTDEIADALVTLPLFPHMTDDAVDYVVEAVRDVVEA
jgi:dTDP-4-amino-4,6-dideoxygalactose transaminase